MYIHREDLLESAMKLVEDRYLKMVHVNFTDGSYEPIILQDENECKDYATFGEWIEGFKSQVDINDLEDFATNVNVDLMRNWIKENEEPLYTSYRRVCNGEYKYVYTGVVRDKTNYSADNEYGYVFVKDIHTIYEKEADKLMEKIGTTDAFTGLGNLTAYERDTSKFNRGNIGVIFADINGLKYANDNKGHSAGDKLILEFVSLVKSAFPDWKAYRRSGDEFIIISYNADLRMFLQRAVAWHRWLWSSQDHPTASVGYAIGVDIDNVDSIVDDAEKAMYADKGLFYQKFSQYRR